METKLILVTDYAITDSSLPEIYHLYSLDMAGRKRYLACEGQPREVGQIHLLRFLPLDSLDQPSDVVLDRLCVICKRLYLAILLGR